MWWQVRKHNYYGHWTWEVPDSTRNERLERVKQSLRAPENDVRDGVWKEVRRQATREIFVSQRRASIQNHARTTALRLHHRP